MIEMIESIISNKTVFIIGAWYGVPITIALIALFFVKTSRDERGRAIIGKASIISTIVFIVLINIICKSLSDIEISYITMGNCFQWIYNIVVTIEVVAIWIYKKIE